MVKINSSDFLADDGAYRKIERERKYEQGARAAGVGLAMIATGVGGFIGWQWAVIAFGSIALLGGAMLLGEAKKP